MPLCQKDLRVLALVCLRERCTPGQLGVQSYTSTRLLANSVVVHVGPMEVHHERRRETESRKYVTILGREILTPVDAAQLFQNRETERLLHITNVHLSILYLVISRLVCSLILC